MKIISQENLKELKKRAKSFAWRLGAYIVVSALAFVADNLGLVELPASVVAIATLVIGEITKQINNKYLKTQ